jgi:hypothetical protein
MDEVRISARSNPVEGTIFESGFPIERALTAEGKLFKLKIPIDVAVLFEEGSVVNQSLKFSITAFGATREDALQSFCEDFAALYEHIALSSDDALTEGARSLKSSFLETVEEVFLSRFRPHCPAYRAMVSV